MSLGDREGVHTAWRMQRRASLPVGKATPHTIPLLLLPRGQHTLCGQEPECLAPPLKHSRAPPLSRPQEFPFENRSITWQELHSSLMRECRFSFLKKKKETCIGVQWLCNIVSVSAAQKSESPYVRIYLLFSGFPSHLGHYRTLSRVPCAVQ